MGSYCGQRLLIPFVLAFPLTNMPRKNKKQPRQTRSYPTSLKGTMKSMMLKGVGFGDMRDVIVRLAMMSICR